MMGCATAGVGIFGIVLGLATFNIGGLLFGALALWAGASWSARPRTAESDRAEAEFERENPLWFMGIYSDPADAPEACSGCAAPDPADCTCPGNFYCPKCRMFGDTEEEALKKCVCSD